MSAQFAVIGYGETTHGAFHSALSAKAAYTEDDSRDWILVDQRYSLRNRLDKNDNLGRVVCEAYFELLEAM